ncbi:PRC-barrel domain-containing protein [Halalkalibacter lacteus]|uniref:PRC-barrel domain-containing protein n=1 Tax=Halalkalibacter lacteus TaxID=3090663 RepID=UPI002FCB0EDE
MLYKASTIQSCTVQATDGDLGKVKDLYFDSEKWTIRYLVVDTLKWLPGKRVLVSPVSFDNVELDNNNISIFSSTDEIKNSPSVEEHQPITRVKELELHSYYGWSPYWVGGGLWGPGNLPLLSTKEDQQYVTEMEDDQSFLRSVNELRGQVFGYNVKGIDHEELGTVVDFVIDDNSWVVHYLIIDTGDWLPGRKVAISPESIDSIDWVAKDITINLRAAEVEEHSTETGSVLELEEIPVDNLRTRHLLNK